MGPHPVDGSLIEDMEMGCKPVHWIHLAHEGFQWRDIINTLY
jgi:hypothetical protein